MHARAHARTHFHTILHAHTHAHGHGRGRWHVGSTPRWVRSTAVQCSEGGAPRRDSVGENIERVEAATRSVADSVEAYMKKARAAAHASTGGTGRGLAANEGAEPLGEDDIEELRPRIEDALVALGEGLIERETEVRLLLLSALSGEHLLLLGPPGTAKSELGRRLSSLCGGEYFERLLTRFSVPEELFGPLSMAGLERDVYERKTGGYLPAATVAFIDEIFKANSAILNSLLTLLNERLFDNGSTRQPVPLVCLVGASNELPESDELDALYDRFLLRKEVKQVSPENVAKLLSLRVSALGAGKEVKGAVRMVAKGEGKDEAGSVCLPELQVEEFMRIGSLAAQSVDLPDSIASLIVDLREYLQEECEPPVRVSDRRLVKVANLLRVSAYTNGRRRVNELDALLLRHALWERPEDEPKIARWLVKAMTRQDGRAAEGEQGEDAASSSSSSSPPPPAPADQTQFLLAGMYARACRALVEGEDWDALYAEVTQLERVVADRHASVAHALDEGTDMFSGHLWLGEDEAEDLAAMVGPALRRSARQLEGHLRDTATLRFALDLGEERPSIVAAVLAETMPAYWSDFIRGREGWAKGYPK